MMCIKQWARFNFSLVFIYVKVYIAPHLSESVNYLWNYNHMHACKGHQLYRLPDIKTGFLAQPSIGKRVLGKRSRPAFYL